MTFRVGMRVICVDSGGWPHITNGAVYTVLATCAIDDGDPEFLTVDCQKGGGQYRRWRFRPATDISIFTDMLIMVKT
jgi:hypothetical protein